MPVFRFYRVRFVLAG